MLYAYRRLHKACQAFASKEELKAVRRAFEYASEAHKNDRRKSGEPYIFHPIAVARLVVKEVGLRDPIAVQCALLHDVVEDTFATLEDMEREFGPTVAKIIDGLTKVSGVFDPGTSKQAENFRKMLLLMSDDVRVALIKLADRLHNMRTLESVRQETQLKIASETQYLYAPLAHRLGLYQIKQELEDLSLKYTENEAYSAIIQKLRDTKVSRRKYIQGFVRPVSKRLKDIGLNCKVEGRVKSVSSIYRKMKRQNIPFEEVYDLFAVRIIIEAEPDEEKLVCWRAYSAITSTYRPHPERTRDWISIPRASGYESLHVTVMGPNGRWVEVQIRSRRMHEEAERGPAAHWRYKDGEKPKAKNGKAKEPKLDSLLSRVRDILENQQLSALDVVSEFKSQVDSDEIYVFTPKGDLKILPLGATALDFAYEIHTALGHNCIGAKVNSQVVPLSESLHNGDQVEVITSKKQEPKPEWLDFVKTSKARHKIKERLKEQHKEIAAKGQEIFEWKIGHMGVNADSAIVTDLLAAFRIPNLQELYYRIGSHRIAVKEVVEFIEKHRAGEAYEPEVRHPNAEFDRFLRNKLGLNPDSLIIGKELDAEDYRLAGCCQPIPGDTVVGILDGKGGLLLHRTNCPTAIEQMSRFGQRIVKAKWTELHNVEFLTAFKIVGQDRKGMLNSIIRAVSLSLKLNIQGLTIDSNDGMFEAELRLYVKNTDEAEKVIENLKRVQGIFSVVRSEM